MLHSPRGLSGALASLIELIINSRCSWGLLISYTPAIQFAADYSLASTTSGPFVRFPPGPGRFPTILQTLDTAPLPVTGAVGIRLTRLDSDPSGTWAGEIL